MFAIRITLEYEHSNEMNIIKELKKYLLELNISNNEINNLIFNFYKYYGINIELNTISEIQVLPFNIFNQLFRNNNFMFDNINSLNEIFNVINETHENNNTELQDVILTVDNTDLNKLNKIILKENLNIDCSICLDKLIINDEIIELNCSHKFHTKCIFKYFSEYNNKCPICRVECGKPKYIF